MLIYQIGKITVKGNGTASDLLRVENSNNSSEFSYIQPVGAGFKGSRGRIDIVAQGSNSDTSFISIIDTNGSTTISGNGVSSPKMISPQSTQESLIEIKKNIEILNENAIDIIQNADICKYNLKNEDDKQKKHIGFVVGGNYRCPDEIQSNDKKGVEVYSIATLAWKAIQEITDMIENLQNRISILEGSE